MSKTEYATTRDGLLIAYREWGSKDPVHVYVSEMASSVDTRDLHPSFIRLWRQLGSISRVVALDRRNTGASDSSGSYDFGNLDDFVLDILAVVDATGAEQVVLTGEGSSGAGVVAFALAHPDRVSRLCLFNSTAKAASSADYPIAPYSEEDIEAIAAAIPSIWGQGAFLARYVPALAVDPTFLEVCGRVERLVCTPSAFASWLRSVTSLDIRHLVSQLDLPTLVYFTGDTLQINRAQNVDLAERIPGAQFVEATGELFYQPDGTLQLDVIANFIGGSIDAEPSRLSTLVFLDVVDSTALAAEVGDATWMQTLDDLDSFVHAEVDRHHGRVVNFTGDGHVALFESVSDAVQTAMRLSGGVRALGLEIRVGVHAGEVTVRRTGDVGGLAVHMGARVLSVARPGEVLVSEPVAKTLADAPVRFTATGLHIFKGIAGEHRVFSALRDV